MTAIRTMHAFHSNSTWCTLSDGNKKKISSEILTFQALYKRLIRRKNVSLSSAIFDIVAIPFSIHTTIISRNLCSLGFWLLNVECFKARVTIKKRVGTSFLLQYCLALYAWVCVHVSVSAVWCVVEVRLCACVFVSERTMFCYILAYARHTDVLAV